MVAKRKNRFNAGWLEPKAVALNDLEMFLAGADEMTNVICLPEGGFKTRYGLAHIERVARKIDRAVAGVVITTPNEGTGANANDDKTDTLLTTTTAVGIIDPYVVVHYDLGAPTKVPFADVVNATLSTGSSTEFVIQASTNNLAWTTLGAPVPLSTAAITERRKVFGIYRYFRFVRIGATNLGAATVSLGEFNIWVESDELSAVRQIRYKFNIDQRYLFVLSDKNISIYRNKVYQADVRATHITSDTLQKINWTFGGDKTFICHEDFDIQEVTRLGADDRWSVATWQPENIPYYDFVPSKTLPPTTLTPSAVSGVVTLTAGAATFVAGDVNQIIEGNGGRAKIIAFTSATVVTAITEVPFYNTTAITANNWNIQRGFEPMWSATRGYVRSLAFYQQRLWLAGLKSRPRTVIGSVLGDHLNFDAGAFRDTDAIIRDLDNEEPIVNILAHRALNLFTTGAESAILLPRGIGLTNDTVHFVPETEKGSQRGLRPVVSNGVIIFIQRGGDSVIQTVYDDTQQAFTATNLSVLASHLIRTPVDFDIRRSTSADEADTLLIVNSDGTLANCVFVSEENVKGFTLFETDGKFKSVCADEEDIYFIVERTINGVPNNYLEYADPNSLSDSSVTITAGLPSDTFIELDRLEGKTVNVWADGVYLNDQVVVGGQIQTERAVQTSVTIGLNFIPTVKTLPFEAIEVVGDQMGTKKRITDCRVWFYQTVGCEINGAPVGFRRFNDQLLDQPLPTFTGIYRVEGLRGWDDYGQLVLTQQKPLPMTVLAMRLEAKT